MKRYSHTSRFSISHFDANKAKVAKKYDIGDKGYLTDSELAKLYVTEVHGAESYGPDDLNDALTFLGVSTQIRAMYTDLWSVISYYGAANTWRGNFRFNFGCGNARTGRTYVSSVESMVFEFVLDLFSTDFLVENLDDAALFVGPKDFQGQASPWNVDPGYSSRTKIWYWSRSGLYPVIYPNLLQCTATLDSLRTLAGTSGGVSFYGMLVLGGVTYWVNNESQPYANFFVPISDLQSSGTP